MSNATQQQPSDKKQVALALITYLVILSFLCAPLAEWPAMAWTYANGIPLMWGIWKGFVWGIEKIG